MTAPDALAGLRLAAGPDAGSYIFSGPGFSEVCGSREALIEALRRHLLPLVDRLLAEQDRDGADA